MDNDVRVYKLSEFAELMDVSITSLRRWDKNGVLVAERSDGCHRSYTNDHIIKLNNLRDQNCSKLTRKKNFVYKDLTNCVFGKLRVLERGVDWIGSNGHRHIQWLCECECGGRLLVKGSSLNAGYNKSCGCSQYGDNETKQMWSEYHNLSPDIAINNVELKLVDKPTKNINTKPSGVLIDLVGQQFGLWFVLERAETRLYKGGGQAVCWLCRCTCGAIKSVPGRDLKSGASQSCGCMSTMSWLEYHTKQYLFERSITNIYQMKYNDLQGVGGKLLSYDFVIVCGDFPVSIIECQGEQHYRPIKKFGGAKQLLKQQIHDKLKKDYAQTILCVPLYELTYMYVTKEEVYDKLDTFNL